MVDRMNLIVTLMNETHPFEKTSTMPLKTTTLHRMNLRRNVAGRVYFKHNANLLMPEAPVIMRRGKPVWVEGYSQTSADFRYQLAPSGALIMPIHKLHMPIKMIGEAKPAILLRMENRSSSTKVKAAFEQINPEDLEARVKTWSRTAAALDRIIRTYADPEKYLFNSLLHLEMEKQRATDCSSKMVLFTEQKIGMEKINAYASDAKKNSTSKTRAAGRYGKAVNSGAKYKAWSYTKAGISSGNMAITDAKNISHLQMNVNLVSEEPIYIDVFGRTKTTKDAGLIVSLGRPLWTGQKSAVSSEPILDLIEPRFIEAEYTAASKGICTLGSAWDPPERMEDGGLYIRQVKRIKRKPDQALDISGSGDPIGAKAMSRTKAKCVIESAWEQPIRTEDGGLWIRQVRTVKLRTDGAVDFSGSGDPINAAQTSVTTAVCILGTAWLGPIFLEDGGLYIRQIRKAKTLEDGSLDLSISGDMLGASIIRKTTISCELSTAWEPPAIMKDGGAYVRQSRETEQTENGELEVR